MRVMAKAVLIVPIVILHWLYRAGLVQFITISCGLAPVPGKLGTWWRRMWYERALPRCGPYLFANWMSVILMPTTTIGQRVYLGPFCSVSDADIGDHAMLGTRASVVLGNHQHGIDRRDIPMAQQDGQLRRITIGADVWVGAAALIMADVAEGSIVGGGAVVTKTFEPYSILAGVPAKVMRQRPVGAREGAPA